MLRPRLSRSARELAACRSITRVRIPCPGFRDDGTRTTLIPPEVMSDSLQYIAQLMVLPIGVPMISRAMSYRSQSIRLIANELEERFSQG